METPISWAESSHGFLGFNPQSGEVVKQDLYKGSPPDEYPANIARFDVQEYKEYFGVDQPENGDILAFAYWDNKGNYQSAQMDWRIRLLKCRQDMEPDDHEDFLNGISVPITTDLGTIFFDQSNGLLSDHTIHAPGNLFPNDLERFDVKEFEHYYGKKPAALKSIDQIGYWKRDHTYVPASDRPNARFRQQVEQYLYDIYAHTGIDQPENHDDILEFITNDVRETADPQSWHSGDVAIAFRRFLEHKNKK